MKDKEELKRWIGLQCLDRVDINIPESIVLACQKIIRGALQTTIKTLVEDVPNFEILEEDESGRGLHTVLNTAGDFFGFVSAINVMAENYIELHQSSRELLELGIERARTLPVADVQTAR